MNVNILSRVLSSEFHLLTMLRKLVGPLLSALINTPKERGLWLSSTPYCTAKERRGGQD